MKSLLTLCSAIYLLSSNLGALADASEVEEIQAAEEIEPTAEQTSQDATATIT